MASDGNARCTSGQRPGRGCLVGAPMEGDIFCEATHDAHRASSRALRSSAPSALSSRLGGETRHSSRRLRTQIFSSSKSSQANCRLTGGARSKALCGFSAPIAPSCSSRESPSPKSSCSASLTPFAAGGKKQNGMHDFQRVDKRSGRTASDKSFCAIGYSQKPQSQAAAVLVCQVGRLRDFHPLETKSFADTPLERTGFEISVPRYLWWSRGSPRYAIRAEQRVVSESVSPRRRRERIRTPVDRLRSKASSLVCRLESLLAFR